jgi:hypothetical protein
MLTGEWETAWWVVAGTGGLSLVGLIAAFMLLLGKATHRKVGLPMLWISAALLAAAAAAALVMVGHR